ncbi:MAG: cyclic pyranopterin monophosphate synthase MoaC [Oligoflexia bacterium]|nr:cyclic pyranopterin monophosphate synthase MoaC [Oligoflexia bacterium]
MKKIKRNASLIATSCVSSPTLNSKLPSMINISDKISTFRTAKASATLIIPYEILSQLNIKFDKNKICTEIVSKKGSIFHTAIIAGIFAIKNTPSIIPFCHPIKLDYANIDINFELKNNTKKAIISILSTVHAHDKTGVEMEALTGVNVAALTIYDMLKMYSQKIVIKEIKLIEKKGGKSDYCI